MEWETALKVLIHCIHYPVASGRYAVDAFRRLGHDVRHVGHETGRQIWGMDVAEKYVWHQESPEGGWTPDLAILMDTSYRWHYPDANVPTIVWSVDNHVRDLRQPGIVHYFLAHSQGPAHPVSFQDETYLPCAYDPIWHTPSPIPFEAREYDVAMIGVMYPQRVKLVNELRTAGLKVYAGTGLLFEEYRDAYWNSRISLCVSANGDVAQRVFETAAMGNLVISDECADFERLGITSGMVLVGNDTREIVNWCKLYSQKPDTAQRIIEQSLAWVRPHTWDTRAQVIVDWYQKQQAGEATHEAL